ncbi:unnamed protein product [Paramecium octaurelia]|uniref:Uncharacterized protein n=1 Tax=Paramecium octaurelia TaxID=43137 RepID=A0A8S1WBE3_PAROT|nr:unnamed protein product [Paramecium octaurelia]
MKILHFFWTYTIKQNANNIQSKHNETLAIQSYFQTSFVTRRELQEDDNNCAFPNNMLEQ